MNAEVLLDQLVDLLADRVAARLAQHGEPKPERLVSIAEAAERLGVARSTCYQLIGAGALRTVQIGRRRLVPVSAINALAERGASR